MINIAICDDDVLSREIMQDLLGDYAESRYDEFHIESFSGSFDICASMEKSGPFDIYLLDIIMPLENGMQLAKRLRESGVRGKIVFVTSSVDYVLDSFGVRAFQYLLKPVDRTALFGVLDACIEELHAEKAVTIEIKARDGYHRVNPESILYVESANRALIYHVESSESIVSTTMRISFQDAVAPLMEDKRFVLAGSSLLINLSKVNTMDRGYVRLVNGEDLYPPERVFAALRNSWKAIG